MNGVRTNLYHLLKSDYHLGNSLLERSACALNLGILLYEISCISVPHQVREMSEATCGRGEAAVSTMTLIFLDYFLYDMNYPTSLKAKAFTSIYTSKQSMALRLESVYSLMYKIFHLPRQPDCAARCSTATYIRFER